MNTIFLTSNIDTYYKDAEGTRISQAISNTNQLLDNLKGSINAYNNMLYIASDPNAHDITDMYANLFFESLEACMPFSHYNILDGRTMDKAAELVQSADFIVLGGGHVPTQLQFFQDIQLAKLIRETDAVICGISAGSLNCATSVYCPPELEGEAADENFPRYYTGLGLTEINIMPHIADLKDEVVDGKSVFNEFVLPDSHDTTMLAIPDGSYVMLTDSSVRLFGEGYVIHDGKMDRICADGEVAEL